jgi:hypothetical protein
MTDALVPGIGATKGNGAQLDRREVLKSLAVVLGGAISTPILSAGLSGCARPTLPTLGTLDPAQGRLVDTIAELILPATDTPGAHEANVVGFVDLLLSDWLDDDEVADFLSGLAGIEELAVAETGRSFLDLDGAEQRALLEPLDLEGVEARLAAIGDDDAEIPFFSTLKEMVLVGYYTSEIGVRYELRTVDVPGSYHGCIAVGDVIRAARPTS